MERLQHKERGQHGEGELRKEKSQALSFRVVNVTNSPKILLLVIQKVLKILVYLIQMRSFMYNIKNFYLIFDIR